MKRFQFSLETLLSLKREKEQEREIVLAKAVGELSAIDREISALRDEGSRTFLKRAASLDELRARELLFRRTSAEIEKLGEPRRKAELKRVAARDSYTQAHAERMALERVKEKRKDQWRMLVKRKEIMRLDEAAKGSVIRRRRSGGLDEEL